MSVYSWENKKRSNRKQTPKGKCVGVWEGLGVHLKVVPMLINTRSRAALSALVPAFSLYVYLFVLCWVDADAEVEDNIQESVFSLTTQVPRVEVRSWDLATSTFTWLCHFSGFPHSFLKRKVVYWSADNGDCCSVLAYSLHLSFSPLKPL